MDDYWANVLTKAKDRKRFPHRKKKAKQTPPRHKGVGIFKGTYHAYLKSPQWRRKRAKALKHYGGKCTVCSSTCNLEVHHRHYRTMFREAIADLDLLCGGCHQNHHELDGKAMDPMTRQFMALHL